MAERKSLALGWELKEMTEDGHFKGYASTRKRDSYGDIVMEGAFKRTIEHTKGQVPLLWFHDPRVPIGLSKSLAEDGHGLYLEGVLDLDIEEGRRIRSGMLKGYIDRMSIGYRTIKDAWDENQKARLLHEVALLEVSAITKHFAANDEALVTGAKFDGLLEQVIGLRQTDATPEQVKAAIAALQALLPSEGSPTGTPSGKDAQNQPAGSDVDDATLLALADGLKSLVRRDV